MAKEEEIMGYLSARIFNPILDSKNASPTVKKGIRYTIMRMNERTASGMIQYFWSAICGTERSLPFSEHMKQEGFDRFEDILEDFRIRFDEKWLRK